MSRWSQDDACLRVSRGVKSRAVFSGQPPSRDALQFLFCGLSDKVPHDSRIVPDLGPRIELLKGRDSKTGGKAMGDTDTVIRIAVY